MTLSERVCTIPRFPLATSKSQNLTWERGGAECGEGEVEAEAEAEKEQEKRAQSYKR